MHARMISSLAVAVSLASPALAQEAPPGPASTTAPAPAGASDRERLVATEARLAALEERLAAKEAAGAASATERRDGAWYDRLRIGGIVDVYGSSNTNRPGDGDLEENFIPGTGSTGKRDGEVDLNLAAIDLSMAPEPVGFNLSVVYGTGTQVLHVAEPRGDGDLDRVSAYDLLYRASVAVKLPLGTGLLVEAGIFPSPIGFEGFYSKDNFNYTRAWVGELSPYYLCGVSAGYKLADALSAKVFVVNGWQNISENNRAKAVGSQLALSCGIFGISLDTFFGPELPDDTRDWRYFGDLVLTLAPLDWLSFAAQVDVGYEERSSLAKDPLWHGYAAFARLAALEWLAFALRGEIVRDPDSGISGFRQTLREVTGTVEVRPWEHLSLKAEARYDESDAEVFAGHATAATGERERSQTSFFLGAVVSF